MKRNCYKMVAVFALCALPVAFFSCTRDVVEGPDAGRTISFSAGIAGDISTRTAFSGQGATDQQTGSLTSERIDWVEDDLITILSPQAKVKNGNGNLVYSSTTTYAGMTINASTADYRIKTPQTEGETVSRASIEPVSGSGLQWGDNVSHTFYAIYPAAATADYSDIERDKVGFLDSPFVTMYGTIPEAQTPQWAGNTGSAQMRYAYMSAIADANANAAPVDLAFTPQFTAFEFTVGAGEFAFVSLTSFTLEALDAAAAVTGDFAVDISSEDVAAITSSNKITVDLTGKSVTSAQGGAVAQTLTFTVLGLPADMGAMRMTFTGDEIGTRTLILKNKSGEEITFNARKKYRIGGIGFPLTGGGEDIIWDQEGFGEDILWDDEYLLEGTFASSLSTPYTGGDITLATDFRSCIVDGSEASPEPFVFQHSADGTSWTDGLPDWILPVSGINMSGATTATTLSLKATPKAKETPLSVYLRVCQPTSGKTTASCMITQQSAYLPRKFRVSQGNKQVYFSKGNLLVENKPVNGVNKRVWRFEDEQYGVSGYYPEGAESHYNTPGNPPRIYSEPHGGGYSVAGRGISHFGWATAGVKNPNGPNAENLDYAYDPHHVYYEPGSILTDNGRYTDNQYGYGPSVNADNTWAANLNFGTVEDNSWNYGNAWNTVRPYCDWGVHFDDHGVGYDDIMEIGTNGGSWYTLSAAEWMYLLQGRPNFDQLWSFAQIYIEAENRTENGVIILPDDWVLPSGCTFSAASKEVFTDNKYTTGTDDAGYRGLWSVMEAAGALFLPAGGDRLPAADSWGFSSRNRGNYWSSSAADNKLSYGIIFEDKSNYFPDPGFFAVGIGSTRSVGYSVRLVHD